MSVFTKIVCKFKSHCAQADLQPVSLVARATPTLVFATAVVFAAAACKEVKPQPRPAATPPVSTPTTYVGTTPAPAPALDPRCAQTADFVCNVATDLVELCKTKETDTTPCTQTVWPKSLFDKMVAIQSGQDANLEPCKSDPLFVATDFDPLNLREKPEATASILAEVPRREAVKCLGLTGFWAKVKTDSGQEGFMSAQYLSSSRPAAATSSQTSSGGGTATTGSGTTTSTTTSTPQSGPTVACTFLSLVNDDAKIIIQWGTNSQLYSEWCRDVAPNHRKFDGSIVRKNCAYGGGPNLLNEHWCYCDEYRQKTEGMPEGACKLLEGATYTK